MCVIRALYTRVDYVRATNAHIQLDNGKFQPHIDNRELQPLCTCIYRAICARTEGHVHGGSACIVPVCIAI